LVHVVTQTVVVTIIIVMFFAVALFTKKIKSALQVTENCKHFLRQTNVSLDYMFQTT